jgi:hypothetical protein
MERSTTPPQNPISSTHTHPDIHPTDGPGVESFQPITQEIYYHLQHDAREGGGLVNDASHRNYLSTIASSTYSGPRYSQLDPTAGDVTPDADRAEPVRYALNQVTRDQDVGAAREFPGDGRYNQNQNPHAMDEERLLAASPVTRAHQAPYTDVTPPPAVHAQRKPFAEPLVDAGLYGSPHGAPPMTALPKTPNTIIMAAHEEPHLNFLPGILRPLWLGLYIFLIILFIAGLMFSAIYSAYNDGLVAYNGFGDPRWFVLKYLPTLLGMILLLWLFQIQIALQRIAPYMVMSNRFNDAVRSEAPLMQVQPTNFLLPRTIYFKTKQPIIGAAMIIFWLQIFTIPLLACLYNVYFYGDIFTGVGSWRWTAVQGIVWTLFALYLLQLVALILLGVWLWRQRTGLLWDPRSIADLITLLDRSNVGKGYQESETFPNNKVFRERLGHRADTLGYWTTAHKPDDVWYGIACQGDLARQFPEDDGTGAMNEKQDRFAVNSTSPAHAGRFRKDSNAQGLTTLEKGSDEYTTKNRYLPWYLKPSIALIWIIVAILLYLAFLIVSFVKNAVLYGFNPRLPVLGNSAGFSSTNFFYAFMPALLAHLVFLFWLTVDYAYRRLQPYASLSTNADRGSDAQDSLLLDYPYRLPFSCTFAAILSGHYLVAWFSFLTLIAATLPVLAGGVFFSRWYIPTQSVRVSIHPAGYYALCVFLGLLALTLPLILFSTRARRLPHAVTTLAEQFSFLYASRLLGERGQDGGAGARHGHSNAKIEMRTRLLAVVTKRESELEGGRFALGRIMGIDGHHHLGIDRIGREERKRDTSGDYLDNSNKAKKTSMSKRVLRNNHEMAQTGDAAPLMTTAGREYTARDEPTARPSGYVYDPTYEPNTRSTGGGSPNAFAAKSIRQQQQQSLVQTNSNSPPNTLNLSPSPTHQQPLPTAGTGYGLMGRERQQEMAMAEQLQFGRQSEEARRSQDVGRYDGNAGYEYPAPVGWNRYTKVSAGDAFGGGHQTKGLVTRVRSNGTAVM